MHLALDKRTNDLFDPADGIIPRVDKGRFVIQQVSCKLKTILGEWLLDPTIGFLNTDDLVHHYDLFEIETRLAEIVTGTKGVLSLDTVDLDFKDRVLNIDFTATTIYGKIDTTIPWDNTPIGITEPPLPPTAEVLTHNGVVVTVGGIPVTFTT